MLEKKGIIQKIQNKPRIFVSVVVIMVIFVVLMLIGRSEENNHKHMEEARRIISRHYPHFNKYDQNTTVYEFVLVADQDKISKVDDKNYETILKTGKIIRNGEDYRVEFTGDRYLYSQYSVGGRGMELSELCFFNGKLLSVSDKTGLVVEIENNNIIPIHILSDGDGRSSKGFKAEWCTVKGDTLYVGSTGQEWYDEDGKISNRNNVFVKTIEKNGKITHVDWSEIYGEIKRASNITKGYITHEAANWNPLTKRWYFLPRKISNEPFNHSNDEDMGNNLLISMDENFKDTKTIEIGKYHESHGYSTFKFLPFHTEIAVGLKTEEHGSKTHTDIVIFHINGTVLMDEVFVGDVKFEGIEII